MTTQNRSSIPRKRLIELKHLFEDIQLDCIYKDLCLDWNRKQMYYVVLEIDQKFSRFLIELGEIK